MKKDIHPVYYKDAKVSCACGNTFVVGSTQAELKVEICSACHPFYTGKQKLMDTARRVEKFTEKQAKKSTLSARRGKKVKRAVQAAKRESKEVVVKMRPEDLQKKSPMVRTATKELKKAGDKQ